MRREGEILENLEESDDDRCFGLHASGLPLRHTQRWFVLLLGHFTVQKRRVVRQTFHQLGNGIWTSILDRKSVYG